MVLSALTGKPTTLTGYGITDAAPLASPTFTGTPSAPTAASGTNSTCCNNSFCKYCKVILPI